MGDKTMKQKNHIAIMLMIKWICILPYWTWVNHTPIAHSVDHHDSSNCRFVSLTAPNSVLVVRYLNFPRLWCRSKEILTPFSLLCSGTKLFRSSSSSSITTVATVLATLESHIPSRSDMDCRICIASFHRGLFLHFKAMKNKDLIRIDETINVGLGFEGVEADNVFVMGIATWN